LTQEKSFAVAKEMWNSSERSFELERSINKERLTEYCMRTHDFSDVLSIFYYESAATWRIVLACILDLTWYSRTDEIDYKSYKRLAERYLPRLGWNLPYGQD
jgi:hypothetical protein